jgi:CRP-like cAMP-binding protein
MVTEPGTRELTAVAAHPLAELLACPTRAADLLAAASRFVSFDAGYVVFRQHQPCRGLCVIVSGSLQRKADRLETRVALGMVRSGDLVELAAALAIGPHTYTLTAVSAGSLLVLPIEALSQAFEIHPPLRMHLLEELAREVSRAYVACCLERMSFRARRIAGTAV